MGYRDFRDPEGVRWQAWDVIPQLVERRKGLRRTTKAAGGAPGERRTGMDRRIMSTRRPALGDGLGHGWLCFESDGEKRRLVPIPADWLRCREAKLAEYCAQAQPVRRDSAAMPQPVLVPRDTTPAEPPPQVPA